MARSPKAISPKPLSPAPRAMRDLADREAWAAGLDPSYGESLGQLLPKRLSELVLRP